MYRILALLLFVTFSCGKEDARRQRCMIYGEDCHEDKTGGIQGPQGPEGVPGKSVTGPKGADGAAITFSTAAATSEQCSAGGSVITITSSDPLVAAKSIILCSGQTGATGSIGAAGATGQTGAQGAAGQDGTSVVFVTTAASIQQCPAGGTVIIMANDVNKDGTPDAGDSNIQSTTICNGINGRDGVTPAYTPVTVIQPCGAGSSVYKEALLGLQGGAIFSEFTGNNKTSSVRNILLPDGSYQDTDDSECNFTVSTDSQGNRLVSWDGTSGSRNTYPAGSVSYNASTQTWSNQ